MKKILKKIIYMLFPVMKFFLRCFFDDQYLKTKHFNSLSGYIFAFRSVWVKNILRLSRPMPFPTALTCVISNAQNIHFHPEDINNFQSPGTYFQNFDAHIYIGKGSYIAPNVGIITANHELSNLDVHLNGKDVVIGEKCWIGMNSVVLPGVILGSGTIVAAGAVVTKSFPQGNVVLGGVPAKVLKSIY